MYDRLVPMKNGNRHLVAGQGSGGEALLRLLRELFELKIAVTVFYSAESFSGRDYSDRLLGLDWADVVLFKTNEALIDHLNRVLASARVGLRLYLAGSESFIGSAMQVATRFNMNHDEVLREHSGTLVRRVWCVHCATNTENVTRRVFKCPGCGLDLVVRDHYSARLAAFMGIKADPEQTGHMPAPEELDT